MAFQWMRRALLALAPAALLALTGCGSGKIESQFRPTRVVVFGDGLSDMGNTGSRFTVNDASPQWVHQVAADYGLPLDRSVVGGTNYATGNARVVLKPDAAGNSSTPTVKEQIDTFLATQAPATGDLVVVQGGISDLIAQVAAFRAGTITDTQLQANARQAGQDLAAQALRLVGAGASHVLVMGAYDLGRTPWATSIGQKDLISKAYTAFYSGLSEALLDAYKNVLLIDVAGIFTTTMVNNPRAYSFTDSTTVVCNSVDAGPGIGIGTGQVSSALCTPNTIVPGLTYTSYMWADQVYPTTSVHAQIGSQAFNLIHNRW